mgnify:CR=1 FL=1
MEIGFYCLKLAVELGIRLQLGRHIHPISADGFGFIQLLLQGVDLLKFGGGFYCGKVADDMYIMNGFYMAMRGKYTDPEAAIYYYVVEWPNATLSWADFRGTVLGATNPADAAPGSLRKQVLEQWRALVRWATHRRGATAHDLQQAGLKLLLS